MLRYFPLFNFTNIIPKFLVKIFVKIKRFCTLWSLPFHFHEKNYLLNWWLNRFWLGLWNTRNLPRQFPHVFLANHSKFKFSNILTFRLSNTRQYFAGDEKIGKYSISCTEHKVEKRFESHTLEFLPSVQRAFKG